MSANLASLSLPDGALGSGHEGPPSEGPFRQDQNNGQTGIHTNETDSPDGGLSVHREPSSSPGSLAGEPVAIEGRQSHVATPQATGQSEYLGSRAASSSRAQTASDLEKPENGVPGQTDPTSLPSRPRGSEYGAATAQAGSASSQRETAKRSVTFSQSSQGSAEAFDRETDSPQHHTQTYTPIHRASSSALSRSQSSLRQRAGRQTGSSVSAAESPRSQTPDSGGPLVVCTDKASENTSAQSYSSASSSSLRESEFTDAASALGENVERMRKKRLILALAVSLLSLLLLVALVVLATLFPKQGWLSRAPDKTALTSCSVSAWGAWSSCPALCGAGIETRKRRITVLGDDPSSCPALTEESECTGPCRVFALARPATDRFTDEIAANFPMCYGDLRELLENVIGVPKNRISLSVMRIDYSTGSRYWHLEFVIYPDATEPKGSFLGTPSIFLQRVLSRVEEALADPASPLATKVASCMPSGGTKTRLTTYQAKDLAEISQGRSTCLLFPGLAPRGCSCQVSEWTEWTVCDSACTDLKARRQREITSTDPFVDPSQDCPPLKEERACGGQACSEAYSCAACAKQRLDRRLTAVDVQRISVSRQNDTSRRAGRPEKGAARQAIGSPPCSNEMCRLEGVRGRA